MQIEKTTSSAITELWAEVEPFVEQSNYLEEAAQELATALYTRFEESIVIARVFVTVPFDGLPTKNKEFVRKLAESADTPSDLKGTTPVLSLIGTYGEEEDWCDRRKSKGHLGIPLISSAFVRAIPMMSRLLRELGIPLDWIDSHESEIIVETIGRTVGLFFVENAAEAVDDEGRSIITAQDFVSSHKVKSVFGTGGAYSKGQMLVIIAFCRNAIPRATAERFLPLSTFFQSKTTSLVETGKIFGDGVDPKQFLLKQSIKKIGIFKDFDPDEVRRLLKLCYLRKYDPKEQVYKVGDSSEEMLILLKGKLVAMAESGAMLGEILPGTSTGEMGVFTDNPRSANVVAVNESTGFSIRKWKLDAFLKSDQEICKKVFMNIIDILCERIISANLQIERYSEKRQKVEKEQEAKEIEMDTLEDVFGEDKNE